MNDSMLDESQNLSESMLGADLKSSPSGKTSKTEFGMFSKHGSITPGSHSNLDKDGAKYLESMKICISGLELIKNQIMEEQNDELFHFLLSKIDF